MGRGAFSESSVPEPLSTDMRSCWKAANPGGVSRGAAVAGVRAASAMAANGARESPNRLSAAREGTTTTLISFIRKNSMISGVFCEFQR